MPRSGEVENVLLGPIRESGPVPRRARMLSSDELDALVAGYHEGRTMRQLAPEFHVLRGVAAEHLKASGVIMRPTILDTEARRA